MYYMGKIEIIHVCPFSLLPLSGPGARGTPVESSPCWHVSEWRSREKEQAKGREGRPPIGRCHWTCARGLPGERSKGALTARHRLLSYALPHSGCRCIDARRRTTTRQHHLPGHQAPIIGPTIPSLLSWYAYLTPSARHLAHC